MDDIFRINEETWIMRKKCTEIIALLVQSKICSKKTVQNAVTKLEISTRYVYRLIRNHRQSHGLMTSLIPQKPNGGKGNL